MKFIKRYQSDCFLLYFYDSATKNCLAPLFRPITGKKTSFCLARKTFLALGVGSLDLLCVLIVSWIDELLMHTTTQVLVAQYQVLSALWGY